MLTAITSKPKPNSFTLKDIEVEGQSWVIDLDRFKLDIAEMLNRIKRYIELPDPGSRIKVAFTLDFEKDHDLSLAHRPGSCVYIQLGVDPHWPGTKMYGEFSNWTTVKKDQIQD